MSLPLIGSTRVGRVPARSALVGAADIIAPPEFAEAVELYARTNGRHGTMRFERTINCWVVEFTLRADDPRMKAWKEGRTPEEPKEIVQLWDYVPKQARGREPVRIKELRTNAMRRNMPLDQYVGYKLMDLGVSGVVAFLEEGNMWGRGKHKNMADTIKDQHEKRDEGIARETAEAKADAVARGMEHRRSNLGIPYLPVGVDLKTPPKTAAGA